MFKTTTWHIVAKDGKRTVGAKEFDKYMSEMAEEWQVYHFDASTAPINSGGQIGLVTTIIVIHEK